MKEELIYRITVVIVAIICYIVIMKFTENL
jgi:hypothetical protein